jgi:hypothetical protein
MRAYESVHSGGLSIIEQEERRRTFWAVYCLDKWVLLLFAGKVLTYRSVAISGRPTLLRLSGKLDER